MKHRLSWFFLFLTACLALYFIHHTMATLPAILASHFDANGTPNAFVLRDTYSRFIVAFGIGVPVALVALLTLIYSRATDMKLPNRDYWLAPERIGRTRDRLVGHSIWFGVLLMSMVCYVHWLELEANGRRPVQLSNEHVFAGLLAFFLLTVGWIAALLLPFRRPPAH